MEDDGAKEKGLLDEDDEDEGTSMETTGTVYLAVCIWLQQSQ